MNPNDNGLEIPGFRPPSIEEALLQALQLLVKMTEASLFANLGYGEMEVMAITGVGLTDVARARMEEARDKMRKEAWTAKPSPETAED